MRPEECSALCCPAKLELVSNVYLETRKCKVCRSRRIRFLVAVDSSLTFLWLCELKKSYEAKESRAHRKCTKQVHVG